jgi:glucose/arabinose dehydrogenase
MHFCLVFSLFFVFSTAALFAQKGDKRGEQQIPRVPKEKIPPSPALTPEQALKTFTLQDGFQIELVASEPLVEDPVAMAFDPRGRIWVVEMRGFMPNIDGTGEENIPGRVSILEDTNGDGRMDRKTVFLDQLVLPRAIALAAGGAFVGEPPKLWFCRDLDGDGKADEKLEVASDYGVRNNPEHTANGLVHCIDNRIYSLYHPWRYHFAAGKWLRELTTIRAQWGLAQDDF